MSGDQMGGVVGVYDGGWGTDRTLTGVEGVYDGGGR